MQSPSHDTPPFGVTPRLLLGLGVALFGVVLLLGRLDLVDAGSILRFWPLLLIAVGLQQFFDTRAGGAAGRSIPVSAIVWMSAGGLLLLNSLGLLRVSIWQLFWPVVLIAVGVRLMSRQGLRAFSGGFRSAADFTSSDVGPIFAVLSGVKRVSGPHTFQGVEVTTFMGGAVLDLRQAVLAPGTEALLDLFIVMGGCELMVPAHWVVSAPVVAIMGGIEDKRILSSPSVVEQATLAGRPAPRLVIRGFVMMGGATIQS